MHHALRSLPSFVLLCLALAACNAGESKPEAAAAKAAPLAEAPKPEVAPAQPPAQAAAPTARVDDPTFTLRLAEAGPYKAGELGRVVLHLEPRGEYHVNQDYPIEISLSADADTVLAKAKLERADAAEFGDKGAKFDLPFTPKSAGERKLDANVKFAVCTESNCVPDERNLTLALSVQ
jgi:glucose/arabinose dehydrogenase